MLPIPYENAHIETNGIRLRMVSAKTKDGRQLLLRGFPEFWYGCRHTESMTSILLALARGAVYNAPVKNCAPLRAGRNF